MERKLIAITAASFAAVVAGGVLFMPGTGLGDEGSSDDSSTILLDATGSLMDPTIAASTGQASNGEYEDDEYYDDDDDHDDDDHDDDDHDHDDDDDHDDDGDHDDDDHEEEDDD